ncbi:hypothetical protein K6Y74_39065, partial [Burkholderia cenocepacia]|uniref:hypothetical protein n=1 Tax=Burkholderia cenocepacia TaxID=95486 RepID=UPI0022312B25|nr:hypothetical protein [Burkholderia cenocepacia]MCW3649212.1 hypothetical protein [Burkholderia cenocepacia]MCW3677842.1 hypothetical protein [Burkholderia cenocepacia]
MLFHWLILRMCLTRSEVFLVAKTVREYRTFLVIHGVDAKFVIRNKRIARSFRLSALVGILMLYAQNATLVATGLWVLPIVVVIVAARVLGVLA